MACILYERIVYLFYFSFLVSATYFQQHKYLQIEGDAKSIEDLKRWRRYIYRVTQFRNSSPESNFMLLSDHGHRSHQCFQLFQSTERRRVWSEGRPLIVLNNMVINSTSSECAVACSYKYILAFCDLEYFETLGTQRRNRTRQRYP